MGNNIGGCIVSIVISTGKDKHKRAAGSSLRAYQLAAILVH